MVQKDAIEPDPKLSDLVALIQEHAQEIRASLDYLMQAVHSYFSDKAIVEYDPARFSVTFPQSYSIEVEGNFAQKRDNLFSRDAGKVWEALYWFHNLFMERFGGAVDTTLKNCERRLEVFFDEFMPIAPQNRFTPTFVELRTFEFWFRYAKRYFAPVHMA